MIRFIELDAFGHGKHAEPVSLIQKLCGKLSDLSGTTASRTGYMAHGRSVYM